VSLLRCVVILCLLSFPLWCEPLTLSFWHTCRGHREQALRKRIAAFEEQNPEVRVELRCFVDPQGKNDYAELYKKLLASLETGSSPVVSQVYENWVSQLADYGVLVPLDYPLGAVWKDMPAVFVQASRHRDGKRYSVPFNKSLWVLYANRSLLDPGEPPQNWTDFARSCQALKQRFPLGPLAVPSPFEFYGMHFVSQGGRFFDSQNRAHFDGPVGMSSAAYFRDFFRTPPMARFATPGFEAFLAGEVPYLLDTSSKMAQLEVAMGERLRVLPLPRGAGERIQLSGTQLAVFARASSRERQQAFRLLRFLTSPDQQREWAMDTGYLPVRLSTYADPTYIQYLAARPDRAVLTTSLVRARVQPQVVGWEATRVLINEALERFLFEGRGLEVELRRAATTSSRLVRGLQGSKM